MHKLGQSFRVNRGRLFDEESFGLVLGLERKRSDRSGRPFLLLLVRLTTGTSSGNGSGIRRVVERALVGKVIRSLELSSRQTDLIGWYKNDSVIGVIYTETSEEDAVTQLILENVRAGLRCRLKREQLGRISLCMYAYPNRWHEASDSELGAALQEGHRRPRKAESFRSAVPAAVLRQLAGNHTPLAGDRAE